MKKKTIRLFVELDKDNIPENILWDAEDMPGTKPEPTKAFSLSIWDQKQKNTLRIDLWTKEMQVDEMKKFVIESMGGLAQTVLNATGDEWMSEEIRKLCDKLAEHMAKERKAQS